MKDKGLKPLAARLRNLVSCVHMRDYASEHDRSGWGDVGDVYLPCFHTRDLGAARRSPQGLVTWQGKLQIMR